MAKEKKGKITLRSILKQINLLEIKLSKKIDDKIERLAGMIEQSFANVEDKLQNPVNRIWG